MTSQPAAVDGPHNEDRAGVNVLIKQINQLAANPVPIALIMITNRADALDPAVLRRAALRLTFQAARRTGALCGLRARPAGTSATAAEIRELRKRTVAAILLHLFGPHRPHCAPGAPPGMEGRPAIWHREPRSGDGRGDLGSET